MDREENTEGIVCFALAVPLQAPATDAISLSVPVARLDGRSQERIVAALRASVARIRTARVLLSAVWALPLRTGLHAAPATPSPTAFSLNGTACSRS